MNCVMFKRGKNQLIAPILECGGCILDTSDVLVVHEKIAERIRRTSSDYLTEIGTCEEKALHQGVYEVRKNKKSKEVIAPKKEPENLQDKESDKSMTSKKAKAKTRKKAK